MYLTINKNVLNEERLADYYIYCGAVDLYCIIQRGVSVILPVLIDINAMDKIIELPFTLTQ